MRSPPKVLKVNLWRQNDVFFYSTNGRRCQDQELAHLPHRHRLSPRPSLIDNPSALASLALALPSTFSEYRPQQAPNPVISNIDLDNNHTPRCLTESSKRLAMALWPFCPVSGHRVIEARSSPSPRTTPKSPSTSRQPWATKPA